MPLQVHNDKLVVTPLSQENSVQNTLAPNTRIILTDAQNTGNVNRLITFNSTYDVDRPWISWVDETGRHVACMGYHTRLNDALGGTVLKQFEIKTIASSTGPNPADLRTRLGIQVDKQRITYGHTYTRYLEVYQGENPFSIGEGASEDFGLIMRTDPQDTVAAAASNFIIGSVTCTIDASDNATMNIDVKPPYGSGGSLFPGNHSANIAFFRNVNLPSVSNPSINIKKGDGTNNDAITIIAKTGSIASIGPLGINGSSPPAKPTVTGSRAANAALASLLTALASYGFVTDSTTA